MRAARAIRTGAIALLLLSPMISSPVTASAVASQEATVSFGPALKDRVAAGERISGPRLKRSDLDGNVVVVTFFASWCPPCHIEFKHLAELHAAYAGRGLTIVAINHFENFAGFEDSGARLTRFIDRHDPPFFVVRGNNRIAKAFGDVTRIPTLFVFAPDGRATFQFIHKKGARKTNAALSDVRAAIDRAFESMGPNRAERGLPTVRQSAVTKP